MLFWLHITSIGLFLGTTAGLALFAVPAARALGDPAAARRALARTLRLYDPLAVALLGVIVMTGAFRVTSLKQSLGKDYFAVFGYHLAWKLGLAFLVVLAGTYVCFGVGHRLVRQEEWNEPVEKSRLEGMLGRLSAGAWLTVVLTACTVAVASSMGG